MFKEHYQRLALLFSTVIVCGCNAIAPVPNPAPMQSTSSLYQDSQPLTDNGSGNGLLVEWENDEGKQAAGTGALMEQIMNDGSVLFGNPDAPHTLTVFTNASCKYCSEFWNGMRGNITEEFVRTGKVNMRIVMVPLVKYPNTALEASAFLCATTMKKGLDSMDELIRLTDRNKKTVLGISKKLIIPAADFTRCMDIPATKKLVENHLALAKNITRIPSFSIGEITMEGLPVYTELRGWMEAAIESR